MYLTPLYQLVPELALNEMYTFVARDYPGLPDGEYRLVEAYCPDADCDCRLVMLNVVAKRDIESGQAAYLASIAYCFDRDDEYAGPDLDRLNPQSEYAPVLLEVTKQILEDPNFVGMLESHYHAVKEAARRGSDTLKDEQEPLPRTRPERISDAAMGAMSESTTRKREASETDEKVPKAMRPTFEAIVNIAEPFCREHLDEEYAQLSRQLAAALSRKRPSPLPRSKPQVWACAIVYALGTINFLWDKTQTPHMRADELCMHFGVNKSTAGNRARSIMDIMNTGQMDPRWYRPSRRDSNPLAWQIMVNGFIVDARSLPREAQEEAFRKGLIPYLPGTR